MNNKPELEVEKEWHMTNNKIRIHNNSGPCFTANDKAGLIATVYYMMRGKGMTDYKSGTKINFNINKVDKAPHDGAFLYLIAECGCSKTYQTEHDIPEKSEGCEHGNLFIKYLDV